MHPFFCTLPMSYCFSTGIVFVLNRIQKGILEKSGSFLKMAIIILPIVVSLATLSWRYGKEIEQKSCEPLIQNYGLK